ncbi:potassium voltage-gated channel subfamily E member 4 [Dunckerocampus dactyliophorus]|uniref:potassium voltage-gated channel subfamily E member 4 n=1 Tax=Dunckerocampus dactyliophorus TaxID=161453 RepID=UPI002406CB6E|nr:potassium voltage-gated channel subfamily E member 4 [Dunckerocampus dactyliophorus]
MEHLDNSTQTSTRLHLSAQVAQSGGGKAYLYVLIVISFYGVFLCGIMLGYFHSKRKERRRTNIFTRLVHEEEQREWGALPKKHSLTCPAVDDVTGTRPVRLTLPFYGNHGNHLGQLRHEGALPSPLACALCTEQSSVSSLCSSADTRLAIEEEESDSGTGEGPEENVKGASENSGEDSG